MSLIRLIRLIRLIWLIRLDFQWRGRLHICGWMGWDGIGLDGYHTSKVVGSLRAPSVLIIFCVFELSVFIYRNHVGLFKRGLNYTTRQPPLQRRMKSLLSTRCGIGSEEWERCCPPSRDLRISHNGNSSILVLDRNVLVKVPGPLCLVNIISLFLSYFILLQRNKSLSQCL